SVLKVMGIPQEVDVQIGDNINRVTTFRYLLRHTFWRPRDIIFVLAAMLTTHSVLSKRRMRFDQALLKEIVSRTTFDIINSEFINEYRTSITNITEIIGLFRESNIRLPFHDVEEALKGVDISA